MQGYNVLNKIGYDCHGLPIEMKVNEILNLHTKDDILNYGLDNYNQTCKEIIQEQLGVWQPIYDRIGRFINFDNEYKTMDTPFMESYWWVFKQLWDKDLVYRGYRIMPFSTACHTPLSNFEATCMDNYKTVTDMSVYVKFKVKIYYVASTESLYDIINKYSVETSYLISLTEMMNNETTVITKRCKICEHAIYLVITRINK